MAIKPILTTGLALASAGAIVAATPALVTAPTVTVEAADAAVLDSKRSVTVDKYNLLGISDITVQGIVDAFFQGYGGNVHEDDPYYPVNPYFYPLTQYGFTGVAYYLAYNVFESLADVGVPVVSDLAGLVYTDMPYFFEIDVLAATRVLLSELGGGPDSAVSEFLGTLEAIAYGWIDIIGEIAVRVADSVPVIGPTLGDMTYIFFGFDDYYAPGITGVVNYLIDAILGRFTPPADDEGGDDEGGDDEGGDDEGGDDEGSDEGGDDEGSDEGGEEGGEEQSQNSGDLNRVFGLSIATDFSADPDEVPTDSTPAEPEVDDVDEPEPETEEVKGEDDDIDDKKLQKQVEDLEAQEEKTGGEETGSGTGGTGTGGGSLDDVSETIGGAVDSLTGGDTEQNDAPSDDNEE